MLRTAKGLAKGVLKRFNIGVTRYSRLQELERSSAKGEMMIGALFLQSPSHALELSRAMRSSQAQLRQDIFVLSELGFKRGGFFVEFGATDGILLSNTYMLEKEFDWKGILAEPARGWHAALRANRNCYVESGCVWRESNAFVTFNETDSGEYSTIDSLSPLDIHKDLRTKGTKYQVRTISLLDLLEKYNAPPVIDYLSIDTEGSEYEILEGFDFSRYQFRVITCEHNFTAQRDKVLSLLTGNGYVRKHEHLSAFEDWYVKLETV